MSEFHTSTAFFRLYTKELGEDSALRVLRNSTTPETLYRKIMDIDGLTYGPDLDRLVTDVKGWGFRVAEPRIQIDELLESHAVKEFDVYPPSGAEGRDPVGIVFSMMKESFDDLG